MTKRATWTLLGTIVLAIAIIAGCGSKWLAGGKLHFDQGRYERALETFQNAVAEQPENGEAHLWLGRAYAELEQDEEGAQEIRRAAELDPVQLEMVQNTLASYWSRRYNSGLGYAKDGADARALGEEERAIEQLGLAVDRFERAIIFEPDSVQNFSNLGKVLYQLGRTDEAMEMFHQAREMSGGRADLQEFLYRVYASLGMAALREETTDGYTRAIEMFNEALTFERTPEDLSDLYFNIAVAFGALSAEQEGELKTESLQRAAEYYLKVLEINPRDEAAIENLAYVYSDLGEYEKSIETGQRLLDIEPWNPDYYFAMVKLHNSAEQREKSTGYMVIRSSLQRGETAPKAGIRAEATGYGPRNDMLTTLLERGEPQMVYDYSGSRGTYKVWCYWTDGRIYIFKDGHEAFRAAFAGMSAEKIQEVFGGGQ